MNPRILLLITCLLPSLAKAVDFPEFYSNVKNEHLVQYLHKTTTLAEAIALDPNNKKDIEILELRNRLDNIYTFWNLTYRKEIEEALLDNLENILESNKEAHIRMEAAMSLGIVHNSSSITSLTKALSDENNLVRKYANQSIEQIRTNNFTSYEKNRIDH